jgi:4-hydroxybenzoate polyprenyltransferase/phosphoserine phosphatase
VTKSVSSDVVLVVDLDGTLLRSNMLFETFWSSLASDWHKLLPSFGTSVLSSASLKQHLAQTALIDAALLPYNVDVIAYIKTWKASGGHTALVTASDQVLAEQVALHLGLFDDVHGSDGATNLKGENKARLLADRYGEAGYIYMGDSFADLPVWGKASKAITVNASQVIRDRVEQLGCEYEHLSPPVHSFKPFLKAIRPHQWLKNILVFVPMFVAHQFTPLAIVNCFLAFIAFNLIASSGYILNDLCDLASDRAHPRKRNRPFASGDIPIGYGSLMSPLLLFVALAIAVTLGRTFVLIIIGYYVATTAYSFYLKRKIVVDICTLACLYTVRIVAGGAATVMPLSVWLLAFSFFFFFSLAAVKRQAELIDEVSRGMIKTIGRGYHVDDLPIIAQIATASGYVSILVLAFYLNSPAVRNLYNTPEVFWGICLVLLYWISHIVIETHRGNMHDDPIVYAVKDKISLICFALVLGLAVGGTL